MTNVIDDLAGSVPPARAAPSSLRDRITDHAELARVDEIGRAPGRATKVS